MKLVIIPCLLASACTDPSTSMTSAQIAKDACPANVPAALAPAADQDLAFVLDATGVQKYACTGATPTWTFVAPEAQLFLPNNANVPVAHHYAGPTWECLEDGSTVTAKKLAGATVSSTAIPWLLLGATGHNDIDGNLTPISSIQRLDTTGGNAPATGCDADHLGATADVPYTARYFFYRTRNENKSNNLRCGG